MVIVKINNLVREDQRADYRGLDTSKIVRGSQVYPLSKNVGYFRYDGLIEASGDIELISEVELIKAREEAIKENAEIDPIVKLQKENEELKQSQAEQDELLMYLLLGGM